MNKLILNGLDGIKSNQNKTKENKPNNLVKLLQTRLRFKKIYNQNFASNISINKLQTRKFNNKQVR